MGASYSKISPNTSPEVDEPNKRIAMPQNKLGLNRYKGLAASVAGG